MTLADVAAMVAGIGLPNAYHHFEKNPKNPPPPPPFVVFYYPNSDDFYADDCNYEHIESLTVELYTDKKDFDLEARVEAALDAAGLPWRSYETYIESERMYMTTYETEVLIDGES